MANKDRNRIIILGGGFGGLRCALDLEKRLKRDNRYEIVLIDQNTFHLFAPSLYEVAVGELSSRRLLIPFHKILKGKRVRFVNATVTKIDPKLKVIETNNGDKISYWRLVLALGADTEDFGIQGVAQNSTYLKSVTDAEKIFECLNHCRVTKDKPIKVVIGGGGFTGVELAGELSKFLGCPIEVTVIEAAPRVLPAMGVKVSKMVSKRLNFLGVKVMVSSPIKEVKDSQVVLANGRTVSFDFMVWTAGVRGSRLLDSKIFSQDKRRALIVNKHLQVKGFRDIYAIGDLASTQVAWTATKAEADAKVAAHNILVDICGGEKRRYKNFEPPFIVPVKRGWAVAKVGRFVFWGRAASLLKDFVLLYYLLHILSPLKAVRIWRDW